MKNKILSCIAGICALFMHTVATSATITNTITYYDHQTVDGWFTDATNVLFVPQFNPMIGTPIKAEVFLKLNITNKLYFENLQGVSFSTNDFIGNVGITNGVNISFLGIPVLNLFVTNTFNATGFDGAQDYEGTSGYKSTNIVNQTLAFLVDPADVSGYSVWSATNVSSARTKLVLNTGHAVAGVYTVAGADIWVLYTYTTECPDCDRCGDKDKDKDSCDKDKDFDKDKDKDCDKDKDKDKDSCDKDKDKDKDKDNGRRTNRR